MTYLIDNGEYVPTQPSPNNPLFDDPTELAQLIADTRDSINDQGDE